MLVTGRFALGITRYGVESLMQANHTHELTKQDCLHVHIDGYHMGVGGDDSWSPSVRPEYLLDGKLYTWAMTLAPNRKA